MREHLESTVPENMRLVEVDEAYRFEESGGRSRAQVLVEYATVLPTVREIDAMTLPTGAALRRRVSDLRGWAMTNVPEEDPARAAMLNAAVEALQGFRVKRVVTPAETRINAVVSLELKVEGTGWRISGVENTAFAAGEPDRMPHLAAEGSPEMDAKFSELTLLAGEMDRMRERFIARREKIAGESRAALTKALVTGGTFDGTAATEDDKIPVRMVISRGLDLGGTFVGTLTTGTEPQRAAQFTGKLRQKGSGEFFLEAVRSRVLSGAGEFPNGSRGRPTLRLFLAKGGLSGGVDNVTGHDFQMTLVEGDKVDVLPEADPELRD